MDISGRFRGLKVMKIKSCDLEAEDGARLHFSRCGSGDLLVLLVHGLGNNHAVWNGLTPLISDLGTFVAVDIRGHGQSDWDAHGGYDDKTLVGDLSQVLKAHPARRKVIVGHSMGGWLALRLAAQGAEACDALVLVDSGPEMSPKAAEIARNTTRSGPETFPSPEAYSEHLAQIYPLASPALVLDMAIAGLRPMETGGYRPSFDPGFIDARRRTAERVDLAARWALLEHVLCPAMVVRGQMSSMLSMDNAERVRRALGGPAQSVDIRRAGHCVMMDNPEGLAVALRPFLAHQARGLAA
jgi:non-heme chloroperoxidase